MILEKWSQQPPGAFSNSMGIEIYLMFVVWSVYCCAEIHAHNVHTAFFLGVLPSNLLFCRSYGTDDGQHVAAAVVSKVQHLQCCG